ncbi:MAG: dihydroorotase [Clostridiales Family XIII bacterium]|nr:dihydroorotase [Clostridiales Family XIII bacterium]
MNSFVDLHVHFRQPGYSNKETISTGGRAAVQSGYSAVVMMPNTKPALDNLETLKTVFSYQKFFPTLAVFAAIAMTENQEGKRISSILKNFDNLEENIKEKIVCISEDGKTLKNESLMEKICELSKKYGLPIFDHAEPEAEIIKRDIKLVKKTGAKFHIQHVSLAESVELIREAKKKKLNITCETAPHYFALTKNDEVKYGGMAKMNPPLASEKDRTKIIEGLIDGTIDAIATDHAPHEKRIKDCLYEKAANGVIGLETAFPIAYTTLVKGGHIPLKKLLALMGDNPARIIGFDNSKMKINIDIKNKWLIDKANFLSKSRNTPFDSWVVYGKIINENR